jgi:hypothetical protein
MYKAIEFVDETSQKLPSDELGGDITMSNTNNSAIDAIYEGMVESIHGIDITTVYREEQKDSLWHRICDFKTYPFTEYFMLEGNTGPIFIRVSDKLMTAGGLAATYIPKITIATNPTIRLEELRKMHDFENLIRFACHRLHTQIDMELIKILLETHKDSHELEEYTTMIMSAETCEQLIGEPIDCSFHTHKGYSYKIPLRGMVPTWVVEDTEFTKLSLDKSVVIDFQHDGKKIIISNEMPPDTIIKLNDNPVGIVCSREIVYAMPCPEPKRLRLGAVISDEIGVGVYGS